MGEIKKLFLVTIGKFIAGHRSNHKDYNIYIVAENEGTAADKARRYDEKLDGFYGFVSNIMFIADTDKSNNTALILENEYCK